MAVVNCLYVAAASTAASAAAQQWWASSLLDGEAGAGGDGDGDWLEAVLRSRVTVTLLAILAAHAFLVVLLALKWGYVVITTPNGVLDHEECGSAAHLSRNPSTITEVKLACDVFVRRNLDMQGRMQEIQHHAQKDGTILLKIFLQARMNWNLKG